LVRTFNAPIWCLYLITKSYACLKGTTLVYFSPLLGTLRCGASHIVLLSFHKQLRLPLESTSAILTLIRPKDIFGSYSNIERISFSCGSKNLTVVDF
ncbi:unnamed protein product, partial [Allacma fusca]